MIQTLNKASLRFSAIVYTMLLSGKAVAQELFGPVPDVGGVQADDSDSVREKVIEILKLILNFMALVAVVFIVIAGIRLVISQGDEGEKDKAKKTIFYVIIGLIIILLAQAIVRFIESVILDSN